MKISWTDRVTNEDLWKQASQEDIQIQIRRRKWRWIGHVKETSRQCYKASSEMESPG